MNVTSSTGIIKKELATHTCTCSLNPHSILGRKKKTKKKQERKVNVFLGIYINNCIKILAGNTLIFRVKAQKVIKNYT